MTISNYKLLEATSSASLTKLVVDAVAAGMQPFGPPFYGEAARSFCQAIIKGYQVTGGEPGPPGPAGPTSGSPIFLYKADVTSINMSDPGTGRLRWNNVTQKDSTELYFDRLTDDGIDPVLYYTSASIGNNLVVQDAALSFSYQLWTKTGPGVFIADFFVIPVVFVLAMGSGEFPQNKRLIVFAY